MRAVAEICARGTLWQRPAGCWLRSVLGKEHLRNCVTESAEYRGPPKEVLERIDKLKKHRAKRDGQGVADGE